MSNSAGRKTERSKPGATRRRGALPGSAIAFGIAVMASVMILLSSILIFITSQIRYSTHEASREEAFQIAETGINFYRWYLAHEIEGLTAQQVQDFWDGSPYGVGTPYEADYVGPTGTVIGRYSIEVTPPQSGSTIITARATGWTLRNPAVTRTVQVRLRRPAWTEWVALADAEIRFGQGTEVFGKLHSNLGLRFDGLAHNVVTSAVDDYNDPDHVGSNEFGVHTHVNQPPGTGVNDTFRAAEAPPLDPPSRPDVFEGGREFPVASKDFTGLLGDLSLMKTVALAGTDDSRYFDDSNQGMHIILDDDGTFDARRVRSFNGVSNEIINYNGAWQTYPIPDNGVIFVEGHVWVSGIIDGERVTIVAANLQSESQKDIYIKNDIRYTNYDGTDVIGLLAENDVEIIRDSENDLRIDAALVAAGGRVGREQYNNVKSTITVFGAIVTKMRYGFAYTDGTGYTNRNLYYDNQLLYGPPPYFPVDSHYVLDLWEEI